MTDHLEPKVSLANSERLAIELIPILLNLTWITSLTYFLFLVTHSVLGALICLVTCN